VQECEHNNNSEKEKPAEDVKNKVATLNQLNSNIGNVTNELKANKNQNNSKAKGFSARFLQNFKRNPEANKQQKSNRNSMPDVPLMKVKNVSAVRTPPTDSGDRSKKIKILGRYFQVS
jgi:uncharacterized protein YoxC